MAEAYMNKGALDTSIGYINQIRRRANLNDYSGPITKEGVFEDLVTPAIRENEYKRHFMSSVVRNYFENSYKEMVSFFAKDQKLSTDDLKDIIELIEKGKDN